MGTSNVKPGRTWRTTSAEEMLGSKRPGKAAARIKEGGEFEYMVM